MGTWVEDIGRSDKVDLMVIPELNFSGYEWGVRVADLADQPGGYTIGSLAWIDLDKVRVAREDTQIMHVRQPRGYREIVRMYWRGSAPTYRR